MSAEEYRPIVGFPDYLIGSHGTVLSLKSGEPRRLAGGTAAKLKYRMVSLSGQGGRRSLLVHRLVAEHFIGACPAGLEVRHLNGDHLDNRAENLAFGSRSDNMRDRVLHGTDPNASKTECHRGHPFDAINTYRSPDGKRQCRACNRDRRINRALRAANVEVAA